VKFYLKTKKRARTRSSQSKPSREVVNTLSQERSESSKAQIKAQKQQDHLNDMIKQVIEMKIKRAEAAARKEIVRPRKSAGTSMPIRLRLRHSQAHSQEIKADYQMASGKREFIAQRYANLSLTQRWRITMENDGLDIETQPTRLKVCFRWNGNKITTMARYEDSHHQAWIIIPCIVSLKPSRKNPSKS